MKHLKALLCWLAAILCTLSPACVSFPDSPDAVVKHLRVAKVLVDEMGAELSPVYPETGRDLEKVSAALDDAIALTLIVGTGEIRDGDLLAQLQTILDLSAAVVNGIDDEDQRARLSAVVASLRIAVRVAGIYAGEDAQ